MAAPALPENAYRARAERGEVQIGTWITMIRTPAVLTLLQAAGLDYAPRSTSSTPRSRSRRWPTWRRSRARSTSRWSSGRRRAIASGSRGCSTPGCGISTSPRSERREQAAEVVAATRYAPLGSRGMYGSGPHTGFHVRPPAEHLATANARVHVTAMLESKRAFDHLDEIAAVPGIDALTIGPTDLSQDLGVLGTPAQRRRAPRAPGAPGRGRAQARQDGGDGRGYDRGGARGDRARRHHHQLLVGHERAALHLRGRGRGDPHPKGEVMKIKAANGFARILKAEGIPWVSCYPTNHVNNALGEEGVPILMMGEERFAVAVADGFSRVTCGKQIGVCTVMANLNAAGIQMAYGAIAQAWEDSSPLLVIAEGVGAGREPAHALRHGRGVQVGHQVGGQGRPRRSGPRLRAPRLHAAPLRPARARCCSSSRATSASTTRTSIPTRR